MASRREQILNAVLARLETIAGPRVARNLAEPAEIPAGGLVVLYDGSPGEPEVVLGNLAWSYQHEAEIAVAVPPGGQASRDAALDALCEAIGAAINGGERTLGGLAEWIEASAPETDIEAAPGSAPFADAVVPVTILYTVADPLGS